jgi:flagellum-specific peptidoglycan hydrolase FlgJ
MTNKIAFINAVKGQAIRDMQEHGILASLIIAQAILESGWGDSSLTEKANNLFGIKAGSNWSGEKIAMKTTEYVNGERKEITANFRKYNSWSDSIADHTKLLLTSRYEKLIGVTD